MTKEVRNPNAEAAGWGAIGTNAFQGPLRKVFRISSFGLLSDFVIRI
jgi:hypothetical protein